MSKYYKIVKNGKTYKWNTCLLAEDIERMPGVELVIEISESAFLSSWCPYWNGQYMKEIHYYKISSGKKWYKWADTFTLEEMEKLPNVDFVIETPKNSYYSSNCPEWDYYLNEQD